MKSVPHNYVKTQKQKTRFSPGLLLAIFIIIGSFETIIAYYAFSRADDHNYFLAVANQGLLAVPDFGQELYDLKSKAAGLVFYALATPSRLLGGEELTHLIWLRILSLVGFWLIFEWIIQNQKFKIKSSELHNSRVNFHLLALIYPGQLAWTASLLRDGVATTLLALGLWSYSIQRARILAPLFLLLSFCLRPEYAIITITIVIVSTLSKSMDGISHRKLFLLTAIIGISIATYPFQKDSSAFSQLAFGDADMAYPPIEHIFDLKGYFLLATQALIDPIYLSNLSNAGLYPIAETIFFAVILKLSIQSLNTLPTNLASITISTIICLWIFAYFELSVGGFSRHRLPLEVILIGIIASHKHTTPQAQAK